MRLRDCKPGVCVKIVKPFSGLGGYDPSWNEDMRKFIGRVGTIQGDNGYSAYVKIGNDTTSGQSRGANWRRRMPYIPQEYRSELNPSIDALCRKILATKSDDDSGATVGMLNYTITRMMLSLLPENARYRDYNAMIGMLHCCAMEFYAEAVSPYEADQYCANGKVEPMKRGKHGKKKLRYKRRR